MFSRFSWSAIEVGIRQLFQFFVLLVLVRFVSPAEFGIMAIAISFIALAEALAQSGLHTALIQRKNVDQLDLSTVFWFCVAFALLLMLLISGAAGWIADLYGQPRLGPLLFALSFSIPLAGGCAVHTARLVRDGDFKRLTIPTGVSIFVSGIGAITLAVMGFGLWALAVQPLLGGTIRLIALFVVDHWRPSFRFDLKRAKSLISFGGFVLGVTLLTVLAQRFSAFVIGGAFGVEPLGFYSRAEGLALLFPGLFTAVFGRIYLVSFARAHQGEASLAGEIENAVLKLALIIWPAMLGLGAVSSSAVLFLFGPDWLPTAPLLGTLAMAGLATPFYVVFYHALLGIGNSRRLMTIEMVSNAISIGLIITGSMFAIEWVAWAVVAGQLLRIAIYLPGLAPYLSWPTRGAVCDLLIVLAASVAMTIAVDHIETLLPARLASGLRLMFEIIGGGLVFGVLIAVWHAVRILVAGRLTGGLFPLRLASAKPEYNR